MYFPDHPAEPRRAAAAILLRPAPGGGHEVLLGRRNRSLGFMGGHHVFPGGSLDKDDQPERVAGAPDEDLAAALYAAVREVFEEAGLLCTRGTPPPEEARRAGRHQLLAGEASFHSLLDAWAQTIHAEDFTPAGTWVTPPFSPVRFLTRYFIYHHTTEAAGEVFEEDGEIVGLDWLHPAEARRRWQAGEIRLSTPIAFVLRHLAHHPLELAIPWLHRTPGHDDQVPNRFEMRRGFHIIPVRTDTLPPATHTNCVVLGEPELYIVDPGATGEDEQDLLIEHIEELLAVGERVAAIVLTHSHPDHTAAVPRLRERYNAPIWAHRETAARIDLPVDFTLEDGATFTIAGDPGWRVRCLHTPGHDPGHLALLEETTGSLLAGDLLANPGTILIAPEYEGDMTAYLDSLRRVADEAWNFVIPAHGLPLFGKTARTTLDELIAHRTQREEKILAALDAGARTMDELLAQAYNDTDPQAWPLAAMQARAHLARLGRSVEG